MASRTASGYGCSSIGRAPDSKSGGWGFKSLRPCYCEPLAVGPRASVLPGRRRVTAHNLKEKLFSQEFHPPKTPASTVFNHRDQAVSENSADSFASELTRATLYKRNQGRLARRLTFAAVAAIAILGSVSLRNSFLMSYEAPVSYGIPIILGAVGCWVAFRAVNRPNFAEFLISTESEVEKVHWPDRPHVHRATVVVLVTMLLMGALLFVFDMIWQRFFSLIGFLEFVG